MWGVRAARSGTPETHTARKQQMVFGPRSTGREAIRSQWTLVRRARRSPCRRKRFESRPLVREGKVDQKPRPTSEWHRFTDERLRIIDDELWNRVAACRKDAAVKTLRFASGRISGRPPKHLPQNLLAVLATSAACGGGLVVETAPRKRSLRAPEYICYRRRQSGACSNTLRMSAARLNEAVLRAVEEHALTPEAIDEVLLLAERDDVQERQDSLSLQATDLERRIARILDAIEAGGEAASLVQKLRTLEARRASV
jgi:Recombinase zinc beta ribbon domain